MIIVLLGYMASGKSLVGKQLAKKLNYKFIDLDTYIESKINASISQIFETKGEIYFRKLESNSLKEVILEEEDVVLSLGGGTPCYSNNMEIINNSEKVLSIYLKTSIPTLVERLTKGKSQRPLISHLESDEQLTEFIGKHLFERSPFYQMAKILINTDNKNLQEIEEGIIMTLF